MQLRVFGYAIGLLPSLVWLNIIYFILAKTVQSCSQELILMYSLFTSVSDVNFNEKKLYHLNSFTVEVYWAPAQTIELVL